MKDRWQAKGNLPVHSDSWKKYKKGEKETSNTHQQPEQPTDTLRPATFVYY